MEWTFRVMEIRINPSCATPEEISRLGGKKDEKDLNEIITLTDEFFMGLTQRSDPDIIANIGKNMCNEINY
jgi:hypothetical protein